VISPAVLDFIRAQTPGLQYLLGVCTGNWILANAGVLDGKNATTNKAAFTQIKVGGLEMVPRIVTYWCMRKYQAETSQNINWIPKARWVVDGTTWTSSGVLAGTDMAHGFLIHLVGAEYATKARNTLELRAAAQGDDEFAELYGLLNWAVVSLKLGSLLQLVSTIDISVWIEGTASMNVLQGCL
jgi:transcriptional regulator GlxA family with amidase domain